MGTVRLEGLAESGADGMAGAASALLSELASALWRSDADLTAQFPNATFNGGTVLIPIGEAHCVELMIRYDAGMILVAFAGAKALRNRTGRTGRRAA